MTYVLYYYVEVVQGNQLCVMDNQEPMSSQDNTMLIAILASIIGILLMLFSIVSILLVVCMCRRHYSKSTNIVVSYYVQHHTFVRSFVHWFVCSFVRSFIHSFIRLFANIDHYRYIKE